MNTETLATMQQTARDLNNARLYARERLEATVQAFLTGTGSKARYESWERKANDLGEQFYTLCDAIVEAQELLGLSDCPVL